MCHHNDHERIVQECTIAVCKSIVYQVERNLDLKAEVLVRKQPYL